MDAMSGVCVDICDIDVCCVRLSICVVDVFSLCLIMLLFLSFLFCIFIIFIFTVTVYVYF